MRCCECYSVLDAFEYISILLIIYSFKLMLDSDGSDKISVLFVLRVTRGEEIGILWSIIRTFHSTSHSHIQICILNGWKSINT